MDQSRAPRVAIPATWCSPRSWLHGSTSPGRLMAGAEPYIMPLSWRTTGSPTSMPSRTRSQSARGSCGPTTEQPHGGGGRARVSGARGGILPPARHRVCHDAPYRRSRSTATGAQPVRDRGCEEVGLEFHSLSKTYNMPAGASAGCAAVLTWWPHRAAQTTSTRHLQAVQWAAIEALNGGEAETFAACRSMRGDMIGRGKR